MAVEMLNAVEEYTQRAKADPRWQKQYQHPHYTDLVDRLNKSPVGLSPPIPTLKNSGSPSDLRCQEQSPSGDGNPDFRGNW